MWFPLPAGRYWLFRIWFHAMEVGIKGTNFYAHVHRYPG
jgi:hypothetical protein